MALTTTIPYEDYKTLVSDSADKANIISILTAEFPDDTCQLTAIKAILDITEETDPSQGTTTNPTQP